jgi:WS/DGAT/MGAT family acyltransferase
VPERLSAVDASFLYLESPTTAMHVGTVAVLDEPPDGFDHDRLVQLIAERIAYVPRYRQRLRSVPGRLANPVWVDDEAFDLSYHVRRSALPRPGSRAQLAEFVARVQSRRLDRSRPLWEAYLVEGLEGGRFALVTKTHQAMVDGVAAVDIAQVIVERSPRSGDAPPDAWRPAPEPSWPELVVGAVADTVRRPTELVDTLRTGVGDLRSTAGRVAGGLLAVARTTARSAPPSPLNGPVGEQRRYAMVDTSLEDFRAVRAAHGASVNDVVLATVAGALREFLMSRGEPLGRSTVVRALVPVSVQPDEDAGGGPAPGPGGGPVRSVLVDLPVGEPSAVMRLHQTAYQTVAHAESGRAVEARALTGIAGFAPPTLHGLGARVASTLSQRLFNLVVTNVPGPQETLYADGARMVAAYPVTPLSAGQALSISTTSYAGGVFFGLQADRDLVPDLDVLADLVPEALGQLVAAVR